MNKAGLQWAHSEIGVVLPIEKIAAHARALVERQIECDADTHEALIRQSAFAAQAQELAPLDGNAPARRQRGASGERGATRE